MQRCAILAIRWRRRFGIEDSPHTFAGPPESRTCLQPNIFVPFGIRGMVGGQVR
jgi:hypothetical protein